MVWLSGSRGSREYNDQRRWVVRCPSETRVFQGFPIWPPRLEGSYLWKKKKNIRVHSLKLGPAGNTCKMVQWSAAPKQQMHPVLRAELTIIIWPTFCLWQDVLALVLGCLKNRKTAPLKAPGGAARHRERRPVLLLLRPPSRRRAQDQGGAPVRSGRRGGNMARSGARVSLVMVAMHQVPTID